MIISKAKEQDCLNLATLSMQVWLNTYATDGIRQEISSYAFENFTQENFVKSVFDKNTPIFKVQIDECVVGFIKLNLTARFNGEASGYEIETLYVVPQFKGQGIGKKLLEYVKENIGNNFWLHTWVNNQNALEIYKYLGFKDIGEMFFELDGEKHENRVLAFCG